MSLTKIKSVDAHSPAQRAGVRPGETLTHINGRPIVDVLDYKFFAYDPRLEPTLVGGDGRSRTLRVRKAEGEELGLNFETYLMDKARSCANRCIFCFVDQMPPGMRETLYFKDDDARLSFLMGNYITLTNLSEREIARIAELRISPINISVHATDPALREAMLKHRRAGECLAIMERFAAAGITMNCQIVACPGVNDGPALDRTLRELGALHPAVGSVAVVPVGVTRFREGLCRIDPYTPAQAAAVLDQVEAFAASFLKKPGKVTRPLQCPLGKPRLMRTWPRWKTAWGCSACSPVRRLWPWRTWSWRRPRRRLPLPPACPLPPSCRKSLTCAGKNVVI